MTPDFSPAMLRGFLFARTVHLRGGGKASAARLLNPLRKAAGIDTYDMRAAIAGHLKKAEPRARLWAALGHFPADHGVVLTDDGGQCFEASLRAAPQHEEAADG